MLISILPNSDILKTFQRLDPIQHVILICDVDGVIRNSTEADADPQVVSLIKDLVATNNVNAAFISGTPIIQNPVLETWRRGNYTLDNAVGKFFLKELIDDKVTIYGALGGQRMTKEAQCEVVDQYSLEVSFELGKLLLYAFLEEVKIHGSSEQIKYAENLKSSLIALKLCNMQQSPSITADEFSHIVLKIRSKLDPNFRLVSYGAFVESHTSNPPWNIARSLQWLKDQLNCPDLLISQIPEEEKQLATGLAHRQNDCFNFLMVSKTNKNITIKKHLQEKLRLYPDALIVTIGDTQVDFPMHKLAHLSYHVGDKEVWKNHSLSHCLLVQDKFGQDRQHVNGTLYVLNCLKNNLGKALIDWNIPFKEHQFNEKNEK